jgi:hypothetical protein
MAKSSILKPICLVAVIVSAVFLEGFIFYAKPKLAYDVSSLKGASKNVSIYVEDFKDAREDKGGGSIGEVCNAFFKTGDVKEPSDIGEWATDAFKKELTNAGYDISNDPSCRLKMEGKILSIYASLRMSYEAKVVIAIKMMNGQSVLLEKMYTGSYKRTEMMQMDISKGISNALAESLKKAIGQALGDVNSLEAK